MTDFFFMVNSLIVKCSPWRHQSSHISCCSARDQQDFRIAVVPTSVSVLAAHWVLSLTQREGWFPGLQKTSNTWYKINSTCWKALTAARSSLGDDVTWARHTATQWLVELKRENHRDVYPLEATRPFSPLLLGNGDCVSGGQFPESTYCQALMAW